MALRYRPPDSYSRALWILCDGGDRKGGNAGGVTRNGLPDGSVNAAPRHDVTGGTRVRTMVDNYSFGP
jgi:hypothetical protein